jgi:CBS domain containing-hemolysin-like protein
MTTNTALDTQTPGILRVALGTAAAAVGLNALGVYADGKGGDASTAEFLVITGVIVVSTALIVGLLVPRVLGSAKAAVVGLVLALFAALFVPVFWSGLTAAFAVGGVLLGLDARRTGARPGLGTAATVIGALAGMAYVASYIGDWMSTNGII